MLSSRFKAVRSLVQIFLCAAILSFAFLLSVTVAPAHASGCTFSLHSNTSFALPGTSSSAYVYKYTDGCGHQYGLLVYNPPSSITITQGSAYVDNSIGPTASTNYLCYGVYLQTAVVNFDNEPVSAGMGFSYIYHGQSYTTGNGGSTPA